MKLQGMEIHSFSISGCFPNSLFTALQRQLKVWTDSWPVYQTDSWPGRHSDLRGQEILVTQSSGHHLVAQQVSR